MTIADYIANFLAHKGVDSIFMVVGGQAMFLNDAVFRNKKIKPIFTHHEQAASMAAEAYARIKGKPGVVMVTAGPGGINALNGIVGGWVDSSPMMVISGQSNSPAAKYMEDNPIRQHSTQGINIKNYVQAATKYFVSVYEPENIAYYMEKAYFMATTGRTGPAWINVPLDIQRMEIDEKKLKHFTPPMAKTNQKTLSMQTDEIITLLLKSKKPLIIAGQGIRISHMENEFLKLIKLIKPLVMTTRLGIDLIDSDNELFCGRPGLYGDRYANINVQNADVIIVLGARMDTGITGYDPKNWGRNAKIAYIDIDPEELKKPGIKIALKVHANIADLLPLLNRKLRLKKMPNWSEWINFSSILKSKYPTVLPKYKKSNPINSYYLCERLSDFAKKDDMILVDTSSPFHVACQAWKIKQGQRFLTTGGISTMGYWPAGIGVAKANPNGRTIVITGDGCLQMNLQELATLKNSKLPLKLFIFNNDGYLLIRHTQKTHLGGRYMGESSKTGLFIPDSIKLSKVYGIKGIRINNISELDRKINEVLSTPGPVICDVITPRWQPIEPRISSKKMPDGRMVSRPYEDMFPFLDSKKLQSLLIEKNHEK